MARRRPAGRSAGGGDGIQAARPHLARIATGLAALAGAVGLAAHAALEEPALGLFGAAGAALMAVALALGRAGLIAPALVLVATGYAGVLVARDADALDATAPLVGCTLLLVAELAYWSIELVGKSRKEPPVLLRRLGAMLGLAAGALGVAAAVLAVTAVPLGGGLAWNVVGMAAAAGVLALIARLAAVEWSSAEVEPRQHGAAGPHEGPNRAAGGT